MAEPDSTDVLGTRELLEIVERLDGQTDADPRALAWMGVLRASVANGNDLLDEARLLHETRSSPRAFALAVLASEEFGKAISAFVVLNSGGDAAEVATFEKTYRKHQPKLEAGELWSSLLHGQGTPGDALAVQVRAAAEASGGRKMDAFYVDRRPNGSVSEPRAVISSQDVHDALDAASNLSDSVTQVAALLDTDHNLNLFWHLGPHINRRLAPLLTDHPDLGAQFIAAIRELLPTLGLAAGTEFLKSLPLATQAPVSVLLRSVETSDPTREGVMIMGKPSKAALSKAGSTLASDSSSKSAKSKAGSTLGKG